MFHLVFQSRLSYDNCSYQKKLYESTSPLHYRLYGGNAINDKNCQKEKYGNFKSFELVDYESELKNITRPVSHCDQFKYNPRCAKSNLCTSTFEKSAPNCCAANLCPIVIIICPRTTDTGISLPVQLNINDDSVMVEN